MNEAKLSTAQETGLEHLKEYLNSIATVTEIAIEAGADLSLYNDLCAGLKLRIRKKPSLSLVD